MQQQKFTKKPGSHEPAQKTQESAKLFCASAGPHAIPVPTALAGTEVATSDHLDAEPLQTLEAKAKAARLVLMDIKHSSSRNAEHLTVTAQRLMARENRQDHSLDGSGEGLIRQVEAARKLLDHSVKEIDEVMLIACHAYRQAFHALTDRYREPSAGAHSRDPRAREP